MKRVFLAVILLISCPCQAQQKFKFSEVFHYVCFSDDEFLEEFGLDAYLCPLERYFYSDPNNLLRYSSWERMKIKKSLKRFDKWNSDSTFLRLPDTTAIMNGTQFVFREKLDSPYLEYIFNSGTYPDTNVRVNINGYKKYYIHRDNIAFILLVEYSVINFITNKIDLQYEIIIRSLDGDLKNFNEVAELYRGY